MQKGVVVVQLAEDSINQAVAEAAALPQEAVPSAPSKAPVPQTFL